MNKKIIPLIILLVFIVACGVVAFVLIRNLDVSQKADELTPELTDEFSRARCFIEDWINELNNGRTLQVYINELRFIEGNYSLTIAKNRIRAVYPRGERFFKLEKITNIEFFEVDSFLRCRFSYGNSGEYMFRVG